MKKLLVVLCLVVPGLVNAGCEPNTASQFSSELDCPADVMDFIIANDSCAHFAGEPYEGQPDREKFLRTEMEKLQCKKLVSKLLAVVKNHLGDQKVMKLLWDYDEYTYGPEQPESAVANPDAPPLDPNDPFQYDEPRMEIVRQIIKYEN